jgi:tetratricopeptide (TPR) repeat protein
MIHSTFSPAGMPAELLEKTFVQRERLAERLAQLFVESALMDSKHHVLLVGPRGIGKSHLVSLIYHRLLDKPEVKDRLAIAYLREDEWGVTSFLDLLLRILREFNIPTRQLQSLTAEAAEERAWTALRESVQGKTLLVILENLETVLRSMGEEGQRKWRACMQNNPIWSLLATTPSLSEDISSHSSPFYGFFEIQPLDGLSAPDAVTLVQRLAESQGKLDIAEYVCSPAGRARVRAVQHLANGNHRVFVIFYEFLAHDKEADLVEPVLKTIDALTPYYQSQMKELSPQQRKLVEFLCRFRGAANVKTIASSCFVSHQTAASQLKQLLESRYLRVTRIGREAFYELNEPLLRICVEAKLRDGQPIRLLVEFLRYWFSRQELSEKATCAPANSLNYSYFTAALKEYENQEGHEHLSPDVERLCIALGEVEDGGDRVAIRQAAEELAEVSKIAEDWVHCTRALAYLGRAGEALGPILDSLKVGSRTPELLLALGRAYLGAGESELALSAFDEASALSPRNDTVLMDKGLLLEKMGRNEEALAAYSQAIRIDPKWYFHRFLKAVLLIKMKRYSEAEPLLKALLGQGERVPLIFCSYGCALAGSGNVRKALGYFVKATRLMPDNPDSWRCKGQALLDLKRPSEALVALEKASQIAPTDDQVQFQLCKALLAVGQYQRILAEIPLEGVAHCIFHEFLELANEGHNKTRIERTLLSFRTAFAMSPGPDALAGGLIEFTSHAHRHAAADQAPQLRTWSEVISKLFSGDRRFEIVIKVFDVMVRYKESGDERVLLELPLEQRQLLESKDAGAPQPSVTAPQTFSQ